MRSKKIDINNLDDYEKFLKRIYRYKSIIYYNTCFEVVDKTNNEMINYIINALNIKKRKKRIEYIYDISCKIIDDKTKGINFCGFKNCKCFVQRRLKNNYCNGCCRKCIYQTNKGCSTKNLTCKLFNCSEVTKRYEMVKYEDLKILKLLSVKNQLIVTADYFSKREDVLKDLYSYTLTYSALRIIYRLIKNSIIFKKIKRKEG